MRRGWRAAIGAPDYQAYLAYHRARHPGAAPMSERDYVKMFIEHRYGGGAGRCC
ncbi:MAG: CstA-like transporter-associated (seleno)protein [Xanthobacteraceae bacterium]